MTTATKPRPERLPGSRTLPERLGDPVYRDRQPTGEVKREFPWGPIQAIHTVGPYDIVEYLRDNSNTRGADMDAIAREHGRATFAVWVGGRRTAHSFDTLDEALIFAIAYRNTEVNHAAHVTPFIASGLGIEPTE